MRNVLGCFILSIISLFIVIPVNAEDCDYRVKAELNKYAFNVRADYEFKTADDGSTYFDIVIYNIVENIYINYKSGLDGINSIGTNVSLSDTSNGAYRFSIPIPTKSYEYTFIVRSTIEGCSGDLRKFKLTIPIRNKYYDSYECKTEGMEDFYYCKEWITQDFNLTNKEIQQRIAKKRESLNTTTAYCPSCILEEQQKVREQKVNKIKKYIIVGLSIGIFIDLIVVGVMIHNHKEGEL